MVEAFQGQDSVTTLVWALKLGSHFNQVKQTWNCQSLCVRSHFCIKVTQAHFFTHQVRWGKSKVTSVWLDRNSGGQENVTYFPYVQLWEITEVIVLRRQKLTLHINFQTVKQPRQQKHADGQLEQTPTIQHNFQVIKKLIQSRYCLPKLFWHLLCSEFLWLPLHLLYLIRKMGRRNL